MGEVHILDDDSKRGICKS